MLEQGDIPTCRVPLALVDLPNELIAYILDYLSIQDLNQVSLTCRILRNICSHLGIWRVLGRHYVNFDGKLLENLVSERKPTVPVKEQCRVSCNWNSGFCTESVCKRFKTGLLPCIQLTSDFIYLSMMNKIIRRALKTDGSMTKHKASREMEYKGHTQDVSKFVVKTNEVISCGKDGRVMIWDNFSGQPLREMGDTLSESMCVDATREIVIGGTNRYGVQLWRRSDGCRVHHIPMIDKVWSLQIDPSQRLFATGSSGNTDFNALKLWNMETVQLLQICGDNKRRGEGILDMCFESPYVLLSAGYDTYIRQWDIRAANYPVLEFVEPNDNSLYCIASDNSNFITSGSCRHGVVRFWDKRRSDSCIQTFYVGQNKKSSPVYSLQFNRCCLYAAMSHGMHVLDFSGYKT